uniref:Uncharacterized protein n=1 Tax=Glossina pallidipes TaxID=7398 RepID=A0A1A9ZVZ1_GLOPL
MIDCRSFACCCRRSFFTIYRVARSLIIEVYAVNANIDKWNSFTHWFISNMTLENISTILLVALCVLLLCSMLLFLAVALIVLKGKAIDEIRDENVFYSLKSAVANIMYCVCDCILGVPEDGALTC